MAISGKVYVVPLPNEKKWQLLVENTGDEVFGITQNILPPNEPNRTQHDDHGRYGHGLPVNPHQVSYQKFEMGDMYLNQYPITEDCFIRVGIRGHAQQTVKLPAMNEAPLVLDVADFNWYNGSPAAIRDQVRAWPGTKEYKPNAPDGQGVLAYIKELVERSSTKGIKCEGKARIMAVPAQAGGLSHWELWFKNDGDQPWIGTCSFVRGGKNDGLGLEAMAAPSKGCEAMQRIEAFGNYGVDAVPGEQLRLGVRGYSWKQVPLPASGAVEIDLKDFKIDTSKMSSEYFDADSVLQKRQEKLEKVQFFEAGKPINNGLEPKLWKGADAKARSTFDAPRLRISPVANSVATPGGGWQVVLTSSLPEFDDQGRVGFVAGLKLSGADPSSAGAKKLAPKKFSSPGEEKGWFIPIGTDLGGVQAGEGSELAIATRGLGWFATARLPKQGEEVDSAATPDTWGFREDQYSRRLLRPDFIQRYRQ